MRSKKLIMISSFVFIAFFLVLSCAKKTKEGVKTDVGMGTGIRSIEKALEEMTYDGFGYKQIRPTKRIRVAWINEKMDTLKEIIKQLPKDQVIELRGHACSRKSPENEVTISLYGLGRLRSQFLYKLLISNNIPQNRLKFTSVGDKEPIKGLSKNDAKNRRVTFHVMEK